MARLLHKGGTLVLTSIALGDLRRQPVRKVSVPLNWEALFSLCSEIDDRF